MSDYEKMARVLASRLADGMTRSITLTRPYLEKLLSEMRGDRVTVPIMVGPPLAVFGEEDPAVTLDEDDLIDHRATAALAWLKWAEREAERDGGDRLTT